MNDALFVSVFESLKNLHCEMHSLFPVYNLLMLDILFKSNAVNIFHNDILNSVTKADIKNLNYIRVRKHCNSLRFILESTNEIIIAKEFFLQDFYSNNLIINRIICFINRCHTADAYKLLELISAVKPFTNIFIHLKITPFNRLSVYDDNSYVVTSTLLVSLCN